MPQFEIARALIIPAFNAVSTLQSWLRPGFLSYVIAQHADAMRAEAFRLSNENSAMIDEAALKYPDVVDDGPEKGKPHPMAGQPVTELRPEGTMTMYKSAEAGAEYEARKKALFAGTAAITVDERLTLDMMRTIDTERLDAARSVNGQPVPDMMPDFAALRALLLSVAPNVGERPSVSRGAPPSTKPAHARRGRR